MRVNGRNQRTIWLADDGWSVRVIDQRRLPHELVELSLTTVDQAADAISSMAVRGAPLIGATAAYGMCLALRDDPSDGALHAAHQLLAGTRPTAVNLVWALDAVQETVQPLPEPERIAAAYERAGRICEDDVHTNRSIGDHGLELLQALWNDSNEKQPLNVLTHCNAGWLATVDWGTAMAPVYKAHDSGIPIHVWVDETRPRNQGAALTAWELGQHGVPHTVIVDNVGGHLMQHGRVDACITGTDRTTAAGDVCNKIGTYLKALAAHDNNVPFYVALPGSTIDWSIEHGRDIPIEERHVDEVRSIEGRTSEGHIAAVTITPPASPLANYAFDVTPARLVTALITERGVCEASSGGLRNLYPEMDRT